MPAAKRGGYRSTRFSFACGSCGHTPGHASVFIESEGKELVEFGDVVVHDLQLADPGHFHGPGRFSRQGKGFSWSSVAEEGEAAVE